MCHNFIYRFLISAIVIASPRTIPPTTPHGPVLALPSIITPTPIPTRIGANIRHVTSPISFSNKMTELDSGGVGGSSELFGDDFIYCHSIANSRARCKGTALIYDSWTKEPKHCCLSWRVSVIFTAITNLTIRPTNTPAIGTFVSRNGAKPVRATNNIVDGLTL